ncbi:hypothetical protein LJY25_18155 [Hymenobacter sp. BT175]|uniref:hypothetical protein n=1 Tax=Hymenobacter translucens TaxID=2886507 RepID=UPI001D0E0F5A|nr:hypothetical protein [Hymenobacter translucens]MCC2548375.1 hypothetical protein [Hymenobacter translucens]
MTKIFPATLVLAFAGLTFTAHAQTRRAFVSTLLQPEAQVEYALNGDDYLLFSTNGSILPGGVDGITVLGVEGRAGYEHFWSEKWSGGSNLSAYGRQLASFGGTSKSVVDVTPELFLRHWNTFGQFNFRQRLGAEYSFSGIDARYTRASGSLRLDLDRVFMLNQVGLRPRVSVAAAAFLRLQRPEDEPKERVIDFTFARAEVGIRFSPHFDFTPWVSLDTSYNFALEQTDDQGRVTTPAGPLNLTAPVFGLDVRYTLFRGGAPYERRQLPTQH